MDTDATEDIAAVVKTEVNTSNDTKVTDFRVIPDEILLTIFDKLSIKELAPARGSCSFFKRLVDDPKLVYNKLINNPELIIAAFRADHLNKIMSTFTLEQKIMLIGIVPFSKVDVEGIKEEVWFNNLDNSLQAMINSQIEAISNPVHQTYKPWSYRYHG